MRDTLFSTSIRQQPVVADPDKALCARVGLHVGRPALRLGRRLTGSGPFSSLLGEKQRAPGIYVGTGGSSAARSLIRGEAPTARRSSLGSSPLRTWAKISRTRVRAWAGVIRRRADAEQQQDVVGAETGDHGGARADTAIVTVLTLREVFNLPLRQAEGFVGSLRPGSQGPAQSA